MPNQLPKILSQLRGAVLRPSLDTPTFEYVPDALVTVGSSGRIESFSIAPDNCAIPVTRPGAVWMPGFVDTHVHFPQTRVLGRASGPLLDWLDQTIFPEEARFRERAYAKTVAAEFCEAMLSHGTVAASVYSSSDPGATDIIFETFAALGMRGLIGLTLMDQMAPAEVLVDVQTAMDASRELIEKWHGFDNGRLQFCVTPRFALSCSRALMSAAGELAKEFQLPMQTHLSENRAEIEAVADMYPEAHSYLDVYRRFGLLDGRSILAHCVHLSDHEWDMFKSEGCSLSHCPDSNFFLGSGQMPLRHVKAREIEWGLGSDVGAGRTFSLRRVAASAYDTAVITGSQTSPEELLWSACRGGAQVLGLSEQSGAVETGFFADLVAIHVPEQHRSQAHIFDALLFQHDHIGVDATYIAGQRRYSKGETG